MSDPNPFGRPRAGAGGRPVLDARSRTGKDSKALSDDHKQVQDLKKKFKDNQHDLLVFDEYYMMACWYEVRMSEGVKQADAETELREKMSGWNKEELWKDYSSIVELVAGKYSVASDLKLLTELAHDLSKGGSYIIKTQITTIAGKTYIVLKGYPGLRKILTGTRYLSTNTKIVEMGIGKLGAAKSVVSGAKITIVLMIAFRGVDTLLSDEKMWHYFVGSVSTDIAKVIISGAAGFVAGALVAGSVTVGSIAVGPLLAAIAVGVGVGLLLDEIDRRTGFTEALIAGLKQAEKNIMAELQEVEREWNWYNSSPERTMLFMRRLFGGY